MIIALTCAVACAGFLPPDVDERALSPTEFGFAIGPWLDTAGTVNLAVHCGGLTSVYAPKPVGPPLFPYGSVTKTFTAALVLKLVAANKLSLDDRLSKFGFHIPGEADIHIRQLLNHTSGLPEYFYGVDPATKASQDQVFDLIRTSAAAKRREPGTFLYSNANYYLLGAVCEQVGGATLSDLYSKYIFTPLSLDCQVKRLDHFDLEWYGGAGAIAGSLADLATWGAAIASADPKVLAPPEWKEMLTGQTPMSGTGEDRGQKYGLGVIMASQSIYRTASHAGGIPTNAGAPPYITLLIARPGGANPFSFAAFSRSEWTSESLNAAYGAFASAAATSDAKLWLSRFLLRPSPEQLLTFVSRGEIDPGLAQKLTPAFLDQMRSLLGHLSSLQVQGEEVRGDFLALTGIAEGTAGKVVVSCRFGPNGRLDGFGCRPVVGGTRQ